MRVILASKSPRRQELIRGLELEYDIVTYEVDEQFEPHEPPDQIARGLAIRKAEHYPLPIHENDVLLTADTIVWINGKVLNKPETPEESFAMLKQICGNTHQVYTGVCLRSAVEEIAFTEVSEVTCKSLTDEEIWHYINTYSPFDKAGSYGIQDWFGYTAVERINGCFYNVMGLPVSRVWEALKKIKRK